MQTGQRERRSRPAVHPAKFSRYPCQVRNGTVLPNYRAPRPSATAFTFTITSPVFASGSSKRHATSVALASGGGREANHFREPIDELVGSDRIIAHADTGSVVDRIGNRRPHSAQTKFTHPLGLTVNDRCGGRPVDPADHRYHFCARSRQQGSPGPRRRPAKRLGTNKRQSRTSRRLNGGSSHRSSPPGTG
jgi:hypothetical protein